MWSPAFHEPVKKSRTPQYIKEAPTGLSKFLKSLHSRCNIPKYSSIMSDKDSVVYHYLAIGKLGRGEPIK